MAKTYRVWIQWMVIVLCCSIIVMIMLDQKKTTTSLQKLLKKDANSSLITTNQDNSLDNVISGSLAKKGVWEKSLVLEVTNHLNNDPEMGLIDIGANIGVYSLFAAKKGHKVVAVEAMMDSALVLHKSVQVGNLADKVTLVHNALADVRSWVRFRHNPTNQGGTHVFLGGGKKCEKNCEDTVNTILMDDLLEVITFKNAVMKVDIEGFEHRAFKHAEKLLDKVNITHIYMEWEVLMRYHNPPAIADLQLIDDMIQMFTKRGYKPRKLQFKGGQGLVTANCRKWPGNIVWQNIIK